MRLVEIADLECCDTCGDYFNAADDRGAVCPTCSNIDEDIVVVESCGECGARIEEYGDICRECVNEVSMKLKNESFAFDKFMDSILISERKREQKIDSDTPARDRVKRYQEKPQNRIKY